MQIGPCTVHDCPLEEGISAQVASTASHLSLLHVAGALQQFDAAYAMMCTIQVYGPFNFQQQ